MKEQYFTSGSIDDLSRRMLDGLGALRAGRTLRFEPQRAALLVLDMQRYFLDEGSHAFIPSAAAIVPRIGALVGAFLERSRPVIFTRHGNTSENAGMMGRWWRDLVPPEGPLSGIVPELARPDMTVVAKTQYDAFCGTGLDEMLRRENVGQVVVTGVMTHLCCETSARSAFMRGYGVFFAVDGTATYREDFHRAALLNLSHGFAVPVLCGGIASALGGLDRG